jgi:toxin YhaV
MRRIMPGSRLSCRLEFRAAIERVAFEVIAADPSRPEYRQGHTLGSAHAHWCRAKLFQQYRLFFRYHAPSRVVVLVWVNDEDSRRAYESQHNAYRTFCKMLEQGHPPGDWNALLTESRAFTPPRGRSGHSGRAFGHHGS